MRTFFLFSILGFSLLTISACDNGNTTENTVTLQTPFEALEIPIGSSISLFRNDILAHFAGTVNEISLATDTPELIKVTNRSGVYDAEGLKNGNISLYLLINKKQKFNLTATLKTFPIKLIKPIQLGIDLQGETIIAKSFITSYFENGQTIQSLKIATLSPQDSLAITEESNQFKFKSTRKVAHQHPLNLTVNDSLKVNISVQSLYNLFPVKVGDVWEFDYYTLASPKDPNGIGDVSVEAIATWKFVGVGQKLIIEEKIQGISKLKKCGIGFNPIGLCNIIEEGTPYIRTKTITSGDITSIGEINFYPITALGNWAYFPIKSISSDYEKGFSDKWGSYFISSEANIGITLMETTSNLISTSGKEKYTRKR